MILLTGGSGYLGTHVAAILHAMGLHSLVAAGRDVYNLTSERTVKSLIEATQPTVVIHCAAKVPKCAADYNDRAAGDDSSDMVRHLATHARCPIVFASSFTASQPVTEYASAKWIAEVWLNRNAGAVILRLPGLFGLPRHSGVIYEAAKTGIIPDSFGPYPAMHVADAAEYLVRAATMPSDGNREPFSVTYGDSRLDACYGSLGVTFDQRVRELVETLKQENASV